MLRGRSPRLLAGLNRSEAFVAEALEAWVAHMDGKYQCVGQLKVLVT